MRDLGIDVLCVFGMPPVDYVNMAADLGCRYVGVTNFPTANPHGYPEFSLTADAGLRRQMKAALADRGVSISTAEGLFAMPDQDFRDRRAELDAFADLGVPRLTTISLDPDRSRSFDQFAVLAEMAAGYGMEVMLEFVPTLTVADLPTALEALRHVDRPNMSLVIDTLHWVRSGLTVADAQALDPALVGNIQLCDAPLKPIIEVYGVEAATERLAPGKGELPLRDLLLALPKDKLTSLEIPQLSLAQRGIGPQDRLEVCVDAARAMLARVD
jgi:sugar phosphate isomerase/epimerase